MDFIAPKARILLVDDNKMNLKLAVALLSPFQMQINTASSGEQALAMIQEEKYHLVFMDHMMPVMDGVETTRYLREMEGAYYHELPVIALTANVVEDRQQFFLDAGMNDLLTKPIDIRQMRAVLQKWLPEELVIDQSDSITVPEAVKESEAVDVPDIEGIDSGEGIKNSGSRELFVSLLGDFYKLIDMKAAKLEKCVADYRISDYTIEVHALTNTARMIGAMELSEQFRRLEQLGNVNDFETIVKETPEVLARYRSYKPILEPYGAVQEVDKREASIEEIVTYLRGIQEAIEAFDLDVADEAMAKLETCRLPEKCHSLMEKLRVAITDVAMDNILVITEEMIVGLIEY